MSTYFFIQSYSVTKNICVESNIPRTTATKALNVDEVGIDKYRETQCFGNSTFDRPSRRCSKRLFACARQSWGAPADTSHKLGELPNASRAKT